MTEYHSSRRYVDGSYAPAVEGWHDEDGPFKAGRIAAFLRDNGVFPSSVCDVGCGSGGLLSALKQHLPAGAQIVGYDIAPNALGLARERHPDIDVRLGDAADSGEHFDLVIMADVFEHVDDYLGFLRRHRHLADRFVFHVPLDMTVSAVLRDKPIIEARTALGHLHYFSEATTIATLQDAGYRVLATAYTALTIEDTGPTSKRRRLAKGPRKLLAQVSERWAARLLGGFSLLALAEPGAD